MKYLILIFITTISFSIDFKGSFDNKEYFKNLVDETIEWRIASLKFLEEIKSEENLILNSHQLGIIHKKGTNKYLELRKKYYKIIEKFKGLSKFKIENITFHSDKPTQLKEELIKRYSGPNLHYTLEKIQFLNINLHESEGQKLIQNFKLAFASAFVLYDNYELVIAQIEKNKKIRRIIRDDNALLSDDKLKEVEKSFSSLRNYTSMLNSIKIYDLFLENQEQSNFCDLEFDLYLDNIIQSSYLYSFRDKISLTMVVKRKIALWKNRLKDYFYEDTQAVTNDISKFFGNTIGLVASRRGKLDKKTMGNTKHGAFLKKLKNELNPFDILLEKTPFRLTDKFIPGHWGHVAIYLGTKKQLQSEGLWDLMPQNIQNQISNGKNVLEALRDGVQLNTLSHFLNVDDFATIRPNFINEDNKKHYLAKSIEQIGKDYDFNFNVETDETIVCSELAYVVFDNPELNWPLEKTAGRYTISPDHVAIKAKVSHQETSDFSFEVINLYLRGIEIRTDLSQQFENLLMK